MQTWALGGIAEYRTWQRYRSQVQQTVNDLAALYGQKFAWSEADAKEAAARALHDALATGFSFNSYYDYDVASGDRQLRRAILERQPLASIEQYEVGESTIDPNNKRNDYDNILNVAIEYPEALRYLLSKGLDPNTANAFGKTPLIYAAQYNQLESVRILLAAGADPNAATYLPEDDCYYTLSTSGMTALHYAARFASAELIRTLVAEGAVTFAKTRTDTGVEEHPFDWLIRHAGPASETQQTVDDRAQDKNPNISAAEMPALSEVLRVPSHDDRWKMADTLVTRSRAEYARGDFQRAYRSLRIAVLAQPSNDKAVTDLPLVAFKAGEFREALIAARRAIATATQDSLRASAWFNLGLICEQETVRNQYYGSDRCDRDWILPFVTAWDLQPTRGRVAKLREIFQRSGSIVCLTSSGDVGQRIWKAGQGRRGRIHILHQLEDQVDASAGFKVLVDGIPMQELAITVLERTDNGEQLPMINGQACRMPAG